jgi:hypothetical protein
MDITYALVATLVTAIPALGAPVALPLASAPQADEAQEAADKAAAALQEIEEAVEGATEAASEETPRISDVYPAPETIEGLDLEDDTTAIGNGARRGTADSIQDAVLNGRSWINFRYRYEAAEVRGFPDRSWGSTLRGAFGHETLSYNGFRALGEIEAIGHVFNPSMNDTTNGRPNRAPIPDPEDVEINQLYVAYDGLENLDARVGRQEIQLGNQRFIGSDPWRQNNQSFDALRFKYQLDETLAFDYSYAFQVNRVLGSDSPFGNEDMQGHFLDVRKTQEGIGNFGAYAYLMDYDELVLLSSNTFGLRYDRTFEGVEASANTDFWSETDWSIALEYAKQSDAGDNPADVDADYLLIEGAADYRGYRMFLASETLGGDGDPNSSFQTPLASLHWFNGFADQFQSTPDEGLNDRRIGIETDVQLSQVDFPIHLSATYHWFSSDAGSLTFGRELDLDVMANVNDHFSAGLRYADFNPSDVFRNANRFMAWVSYRVF